MKIELTPSQAWILRRLLSNVGGSTNGPRGEMDKLLWKLEDRGVEGPKVVFSNPPKSQFCAGNPNPVGIYMEWAK